MIFKALPVLMVSAVSCLSAMAEDREEVKTVFDTYKTAILATDGPKSSAQVDKGTLRAFGKFVELARTGDRKTLHALPMVDRLQVLLLRHRIPGDELAKMDGKAAFEYAVNREWIGRNSVDGLTLDQAEISGNRATGAVVMQGKKTAEKFHFVKEDGAWKLDLVPTLQGANASFKAIAEQQKMTENDLILLLVGKVSGTEVTDAIWDPAK